MFVIKTLKLLILYFNTYVFFSRNSILLPSIVKEFMFYYEKPVFVFPELLPSRTFRQNLNTYFPMKPPEEK